MDAPFYGGHVDYGVSYGAIDRDNLKSKNIVELIY